MSLSLFILTLEAVDQVVAQDRLEFVVDMSTVTSGLFASGNKNPVGAHVKALQNTITGEQDGTPGQ